MRTEHIDGQAVRVGGIITETEAYCGESDLGCHAKAGRTPRTETLYGPAGLAYVYFTYGMHWLLCAVTRPEGQPEAVLIRAIQPEEGLEVIAARRGSQPEKLWTDGPAKLTQALAIDGVDATVDNALNGSYPVVRPLNMLTDGEPEGVVKAFLDFVMSAEGQAVVEDEGYLSVK